MRKVSGLVRTDVSQDKERKGRKNGEQKQLRFTRYSADSLKVMAMMNGGNNGE